MNKQRIDLSSDTVTQPTAAMRDVMAQAKVGDEQKNEDPTVKQLLDKVTTLLGKKAAIFVPSGTMCNLIAIKVHILPGDAIILARNAHMLYAEAGGLAAYGGAIATPLESPRGIFTVDQVEEAICPRGRYFARSAMISIEQTTNLGGGACWTLKNMSDICKLAHQHGIKTHLVGARLMNAVIKTGIPAHEFAAPFDSVWISLTKGLGGNFGAVLAGSEDFIENAWRHKQQLGGAMRQVGIEAAGGIYALDNHITRLTEDHQNAKLLAVGLSQIQGIVVNPDDCETNIVLFKLHPTIDISVEEFINTMKSNYGISFFAPSSTTIRAMTHLHISTADIELTLQCIERFLKSLHFATL